MSGLVVDEDLAAAVEGVIGAPVATCTQLASGRNARVFRLSSADGVFVLKQYPSRADDPRDRLGAERDALQWMERAGIVSVPRFLAADEMRNFALLSWVDGASVTEPGLSEVEQAAAFLAALYAANARIPYPSTRLASEACLSGAEIERQVRARMVRLKAIEGEPDLQAFLDDDFAGALEGCVAAVRSRLDFDAELASQWRRPVPADFGFHNSLRNDEGRLFFLDFEYFGWDDPAKLAADLLLHPGTPLCSPLRERLRTLLLAVHAEDLGFAERLNAILPLFALRWTLILLNEFHPERWRRRLRTGESGEWRAVKSRQLDRARAMLNAVPGAREKPASSRVIALSQDSPPLDERSKHLRRLAVRALDKGGRGHIGSTMSLIEIMRVLYDDILHYRAEHPAWPGRDRVILSKGHGCLAQYVLLADKGFFPIETLDTFCHRDSILGGHPESNKIPGVEASTGALGHGLSIGVGMALAARVKRQAHRVVIVMGDGEINEGSVWEAALAAGKHRLSNLIAVIDYNKIQSAGFTCDIQDLEPLRDKWCAFGFAPMEVDGHNVGLLRQAFSACPREPDKPTAIICHTVKGKGIPFAEWDPAWHHKAKLPPADIARLYECLE